MSSPEVWRDLARAGNAHGEALKLRADARKEVAEAQARHDLALGKLEAAERALAEAQEASRQALTAAQADLAEHGVAGPTKR